MIHSSHYHQKQRMESPFIGFLCLLGVALVASMPNTVESFQIFDHASLSIMPMVALANRHQDKKSTKKDDVGLKNYQRSILTSAPTSSTLLSAHSLTTALERLWEDRISDGVRDEKDDYECLSWLDLESDSNLNHEDSNGASSAASSTSSSSAESMSISLPLYPLSEVYLPLSTSAVAPDTIINHTLNNVEPQNIKMALDLLSETTLLPRFCVVLRAMDTGRIASVGNILRIVDADVQKRSGTNNDVNDISKNGTESNDNILRIRLTCQSEGLAEIVEVENGSGWSENRVLRSDEYLRARVRPVLTVDDQENDDIDGTRYWQDAYKAIREDLRMIKLIYQLQLGSEDYPPDTLMRIGNAIQDFPELDVGVDEGDTLLWNLAHEWQSVCMTLLQGRQALLATERNERMVAAACAYGGPLKLPIHLSDLDLESRREIQKLDQEFQEDHEVSGMDPTLDFQVLIGLPTTNHRFDFLAKLMSRERLRLESIASKPSSSTRRRRF